MRQVYKAFENIGLSKIVEVSEAARNIAPVYEKKTGKPFIYFQRGEVGFDVPLYIQQALTDALSKGLTRYPKSGGEPWFKDAVVQHLEESGIIGLERENILCTYGGQEGLQLIFSLFRGSKVAGFTPCWSCMLDNIWPYADITFLPIPLVDYEIDFDQVIEVLKEVSLFYLNTPHNPTGKVFSRKEIKLLASLCEKYDVLLVSDEAYKDIVFDGEHFSPLQLNSENVFSTFTFSKTYCATGLRTGYSVCRDTDIIQKLVRGEYTQTAGVATPLQYAFKEALQQTEIRNTWINFYMRELTTRKNALIDNLEDMKTSYPEGAFYCFVDLNDFVPTGIDPDKYLMDLLIKNGIAAVPGSAFGKGYEGFIRLSFSTLNPDLVAEGAKRLCEIV
ncbi:hypothetical protein LCGC14_1224880 [marine sediment metagenome]|uniref:Aminotransferase class I/classII large domain-containing protein n=1 Tax=marine sediment metagenome TaxID=412755 RepID=A0A0F9PEN4_9ZZZZ